MNSWTPRSPYSESKAPKKDFNTHILSLRELFRSGICLRAVLPIGQANKNPELCLAPQQIGEAAPMHLTAEAKEPAKNTAIPTKATNHPSLNAAMQPSFTKEN